MVPGTDPTADIVKMMDLAGLDGRLLTQRSGSFMTGIVATRSALVAKLIEYINKERRVAYEAGIAAAPITTKGDISGQGKKLS